MVSEMFGLIFGSFLGVLFMGIGIFVAIKFTLGTGFKSEPEPNTKPISKSKLISKFKKLNNKNPFKFIEPQEKGIDLLAKWDVVDSSWLETLGKSWLSIVYYGYIVFDEKTKTVRYHEKIIEKHKTMGSMGFYGNTFFQKGMIISRRMKGYRFGIKEDGSIGEVYNYDFDPLDLKGLVRQIANENGWNFEIYFAKFRMKKK